jgi:hypothetical protein
MVVDLLHRDFPFSLEAEIAWLAAVFRDVLQVAKKQTWRQRLSVRLRPRGTRALRSVLP